jgi:hypothetical protein
MIITSAQRKQAHLKMGIQGPSGSGKTYSSLLLAKGMASDYGKVVVIDTENESSHLYSHIGDFKVLSLKAPFTPEKYIEAITLCEQAGMEVIILDSVTHEWEYLLDFHSNLQGNSFTNWGKVTPRHSAFVQKMLQSPCHIIATMRTKQDYVISERNGRMVPEKVGLKSVQRDGMDYEFTLVFDLDSKNNAVASKDRTGLFYGQTEHRLSVETGKRLMDWCATGASITPNDVVARINDCKSLNELLEVYKQYPDYKQSLLPEFEAQKRRLLIQTEVYNQLAHSKTLPNGTL